MDEFATLLFGKPIKDLTGDDIGKYFQESRMESDKLEFKSFPSGLPKKDMAELEKKILRGIVAFLNSDGGVLIWGAPQGDSADKKETFQGALIASDIRIEKDAFMAKIANKIIPSPRGIRFYRVETEDGRYIYLFDVPASEYAPHQVDNVYYMRLDGQTVAAPHHYIEALFKKVSFPKLEAYLKIVNWSFEEGHRHTRLQCTIIFRNVSAFQNDYDLHCRIVTDTGLVVFKGSSYTSWDDHIIKGTDHSSGRIADTIYYHNYVHYDFDLILDRDYLYRNAYQFKLEVVFGSRLAPMRKCWYTLQMGPKYPDKKQTIIIEKEENLYLHEKDSEDMADQQELYNLLNME